MPMPDFPLSTMPNDIWSILKRPEPPTPRDRWLRWHPAELEHCLAARAAQLPAPLTGPELTELLDTHQGWGADETTLDSIQLLADPTVRVIITGQQPGMLAGPMLVLYKTMAALDLARRLGQRHPELKFVPVFWVASEDHDFDEIRRVYWPGHSGQLEEFLLPQTTWKWGQMVGRIPTAEFLPQLTEMVNNSTFKTEFGPEVFRFLNEAYGGDANLESGFCRLLLRLFAGSGLVIVSPLANWVRRRAAGILQAEFADPGASSRAIIERGEVLAAAGFPPALHRPAEAINAFWLDAEGRRYTLRLEGGEVHRALPQNDEEFHIDQPPLATSDLTRMLRENPRQFSTNVATRPMVQDAILPTVAQVIGPGEAAYLAQVEPLYPRFGVFTPLRWPRPQVFLIEPRVERSLEKYRLDIETVLSIEPEELTKTIIRRDMETTELHEVEEIRLHQLSELQALREKFGTNNPAVDSAFEKLIQMNGKGFTKVTERMLYQRQQDERSLNQAVALILNCLRPNHQPQERLLNPIIPYAINYDLDWVARLAALVSNDPTLPEQIFHFSQLVRATEKL